MPTPCWVISISMKREYDKAIAEGERAVALEPGGADAHDYLCHQSALSQAGRRKPFQCFKKQSDSTPTVQPFYFHNVGHAYRVAGRFEEAISTQYKKALLRGPAQQCCGSSWSGRYLQLMGREKEARAEAAEVLRINPKFSLDSYAKTVSHKNQAQMDRYIAT